MRAKTKVGQRWEMRAVHLKTVVVQTFAEPPTKAERQFAKKAGFKIFFVETFRRDPLWKVPAWSTVGWSEFFMEETEIPGNNVSIYRTETGLFQWEILPLRAYGSLFEFMGLAKADCEKKLRELGYKVSRAK